MSENMIAFLVMFSGLYIIAHFYLVKYFIYHEKTLENFNLYETLFFLPFTTLAWAFKGISFLVMKLVKTNYVQAFHRFMLQKPSDLINFRITIEKKD